MKKVKMDKIIFWIYEWLPRIFGCHKKAERSFIINKRKMPICARCTGELFGIIGAMFFTKYLLEVSNYIYVIMMIPLILDGTIQMCTKYESNNSKRFITGILFGIALYALFVKWTVSAYLLGQKIVS